MNIPSMLAGTCRLVLSGLSAVLLVLATGSAHAGVFFEVGDAGGLPSTAQAASVPNGSFDQIRGALDPDGDDGQDLYLLYISGGGTFSAVTESGASFDTELFLLDSSGRGVYLNDDTVGFDDQSILPANHPLTPLAAGFYYLGITQCCSEPVSAAGPIFPPTENANHLLVQGPTGIGGSLPIVGYAGNFSQGGGAYTIFLTGATVSVLPEPSAWVLFAVGACILGAQLAIRSRAGRAA